MKRIITLVIFLGLTALKVNAQNGLSEIIKATPGDATKLFNAYAEPLFKGFGIGTNSGWTNTAKTKGFLRFDVRVSATAAFVPQNAKTFDVTQIGLSNNVRPTNANQTIAPTVGGNSASGPSLSIYDNSGNKLESFNTPGGSSNVFGAPQIQITVGLPYNTDVILRGMPVINFGSNLGSVGSIGIGVKHNIMQDFFGKADKVLPFDAAFLFGFTHTSYAFPLNVQPYDGAKPKDAQQNTDFTNQHFGGLFNSYVVQAVFSKKLAVFTPFASVYYSSSNTYMVLQGNYPLTTGIDNIITRNPTYTTFTNPININEKSVQGAQADVGFQVSVGFFKVYASYIFAEYRSVNAGIGLGL